MNSSSYEDYTERHRRRNKVCSCLRKCYFYSLHLWLMQGFSFGSAPARKLPYRAPGAIQFRLFSTRRMWPILLLSAVLPVQRPTQPTKRPCRQSRRSIRSILRLHRTCHVCCHPSKLVQVNPFVRIMRRTNWCALAHEKSRCASDFCSDYEVDDRSWVHPSTSFSMDTRTPRLLEPRTVRTANRRKPMLSPILHSRLCLHLAGLPGSRHI